MLKLRLKLTLQDLRAWPRARHFLRIFGAVVKLRRQKPQENKAAFGQALAVSAPKRGLCPSLGLKRVSLALVFFAGLVLFFSQAALAAANQPAGLRAEGRLLALDPPGNANPPSEDECTKQGLEKAANGLCLPKAPISGGFASSTSVGDFIIKVIQILLVLAGVIAVLFVIIGGFQYVTSGGNEEAAKKGKKTLTNAVIGIVVVVLAFAIINVVVNTLTSGGVFGGSSGSNSGSSGFFQR